LVAAIADRFDQAPAALILQFSPDAAHEDVDGPVEWVGFASAGEVEQLIARTGLVATAAVRLELAEDLTARTLVACVPLVVEADGSARSVPEHLRALTSPQILAIEGELTTRLVARAAHTPASPAMPAHLMAGGIEAAKELDAAQKAVVAALAGTGPLTLVEGAAGAGKTTTLAATRQCLERQGHRLVVVTPTLKAARVAADETGTTAYSAAWLAHQHGYRWDTHGTWTRLRAGQSDPLTGATYRGPHPDAVLRPGDLLLVDEAGMLDQETARALLRIADAADARVVYVGDRRQLPAVGRGGVLDMAAQWATTRVELAAVHRFRTPDGHLDTQYADLTLRIRSGIDPEAVFDDLNAGGHIKVWDSEADALGHLAVQTTHRRLHGVSQAVAVDTNDTAAAVNEVVRDQLVTAGAVDDATVTHGSDGLRIGKGDHVMTRHNNPDLGVANRMTWTVQGIADTGGRVLSCRGWPRTSCPTRLGSRSTPRIAGLVPDQRPMR